MNSSRMGRAVLLLLLWVGGPAHAVESIRAEMASDLVPSPVEYAVIAPDGFRNLEDLPLVLNLHGGGGNRERLFDQAALWGALWARGVIPPAVVVMPSVAPRGFYMNYRDGSERWEDFVAGPFLEHLRATLPVTAEASGTYITGVSMGGMGALRIAFRNPEAFAAVAALEPGVEPILRLEDMAPEHRFWRSDALLERAFGTPLDPEYWRANHPAAMAADAPSAIRDAPLQIYLEAGDEDQFWLYEGAEFLHRVLWDLRIPHEYHLVRGADHVGPSLRERLEEAILFLFRTRTPWATTPRMAAVDRMLDPLKGRIEGTHHYEEAPVPDHYAESAMISFLSEDGETDLSLRLARFPNTNEAHVWLHAAFDGRAWSLVDEGFTTTGPAVTRVEADRVTFGAVHDSQTLDFHATDRGEGLTGYVSANLLVAETRHPEAGTGTLPAHVQLVFEARSPGMRSGAGRWEMPGHLTGFVTIEGVTKRIDAPGKWHEQTGPRPRFAPAFTYLALQGETASLLALGSARGTGGYVETEAGIVAIRSFEIDPEGPEQRAFTLGLADGRTIEGVARVVQRWSVPMEGQRRPGTSVLVESGLGVLQGSLNDWAPE